MVLAEPVAAQRESQEGEESDVRDLEVHMDRGLSAEPDEAMALAEPVADQGDKPLADQGQATVLAEPVAA